MSDQHTIVVPSRPMRATSIKGLIPSLPERGKIKIGAKGPKRPTRSGQGEWQPPVKLDHFVITTLARNPNDDNLQRDEEMHERFGDNPTEIPIRLLYDDIELNFPTRYAAYNGRTLWCSGDGETAQRLGQDGRRFELQCPCHLADPTYEPKSRNDMPRCKMNGSLSVIIDGASGLGGVWKFRTTSYNSINGIMSSMIFLRQITGGILANIPLTLRVQPKQASNPRDGSSVLIYVVSLEFSGNVEALQGIGHQIALNRATTHISIANIENEARRMLALAAPANAPLPGDEAEEVAAEFYPEEYDKEPEGWTENARPTRQQFKKPQQPETKSGVLYDVDLIDGEVAEDLDAGQAFAALTKDMNARAIASGQAGLEAFWKDNKDLMELLNADGYVEELGAITEEYNTISARLASGPGEREVRSATVAQRDGQTGEKMEEHTDGVPPSEASSGASSLPEFTGGGTAKPSIPTESGPAISFSQNLADLPQDRPQAVPQSPNPAMPPGDVIPLAGATSPPALSVKKDSTVYAIGDAGSKPEQRREVVQDTRTSPTNRQAHTHNATPPVNADAGGKPRYRVEPIMAGKVIDWIETNSTILNLIPTLAKDEYDKFRKVNEVILAHFSGVRKADWQKINEALAAKDREFYG